MSVLSGMIPIQSKKLIPFVQHGCPHNVTVNKPSEAFLLFMDYCAVNNLC